MKGGVIIRYILNAILLSFLLILFLGFSIGASDAETVFESVYYGGITDEDNGYFSDIKRAIEAVSDKGRVYISQNAIVDSTIKINKSIELISLNSTKPLVASSRSGINVFNLMTTVDGGMIEYFKLTNIKSGAFNNNIITGIAGSFEIEKCTFYSSTAIKIYAPNENLNISILDSYFENADITIDVNSGTINLFRNNITEKNSISSDIILTNLNIIAIDNIFNNGIFRLQGSKEINGNISDNDFIGDDSKIFITSPGTNLHFNKNRITRDLIDAVYYDYDDSTIIDFTQNWWGSISGPKDYWIGDNDLNLIDFSNWALKNDFSRFVNGPYSTLDLKNALALLGQAVSDSIYDLDYDGDIELLDIIWLIRKIQ